MNREYGLFILDIVDSINKIERFCDGITYDDFVRDEKTLYATVRALEIIGEASKKIPTIIKEKYSSIPWSEIVGMRNKLTHEYFGLSVRIIWKTVKEDIPFIKPYFMEMANNL